MTVLVTGGAGYIGSVVAEALVLAGQGVVVYDNLYRGHRDAVPEGAQFAYGDLHDGVALRRALRDHRVDAVVHMAAHSLVGESIADPAKYYRDNVGAGLSLLQAMHETQVQRLVFSSTVSVYGAPATQPIEESAPTAPVNPYGDTKLAFERALHWYGGAYGLRAMSLRYFNAAGATERNGERHDPETHLVPLVLEAAAGRRAEIVVFGDDYPTRDGTCVRDYIHVSDLAHAHVLALDALAHGAESRVYNLGCAGAGHTVREVIDVTRRVTGRDVPVRIGPRRAGDPAVLTASSERITRELGWRPRMPDLGEIVESVWKWMHRTTA